MYWLPILGAFALGSGTILQKVILRKRKIDIRLYFSTEFLAIVLLLFPIIFFFWKFEALAFSIKNIFILGLVVFFSILANLFALYAMKKEKVEKIEPAKLLEPLFVILLVICFSYIFGQTLYSTDSRIVIPSIIAGFALIFSHIKKHHLEFNKYFLAAIAGSFFFAVELVLSRLILDFYNPISFYFIRSLLVFIIIFFIFRPEFSKLNSKIMGEIFLMGIIWVIYRIVVYYGYITLGVISTTLVLMLAPIFVYLMAYNFLHEKIHWRNIVASIIIVACIIYAYVG